MSNTTLKEVQDIHEQIRVLEARATLLMQEGRADAIEQIKTMIAAYKIEPAELGLVLKAPPRNRAAARNPRPPMYKDPATGATWTGQGAAPKWLEGQDRAQFRIVPVPDVRLESA